MKSSLMLPTDGGEYSTVLNGIMMIGNIVQSLRDMAFSRERLNWAAGRVVVGKRAVGRKVAGRWVRFFMLAGLCNFVSWKRILARVHILI